MSGHWTDKYSFTTGAVRFHDLGYLILTDDSIDQTDIPHSQFITWDAGQWGNAGQKSWTTVSACICKHPTEQMVAIGPYGEAMLIGGGDIHEEEIEDGEDSPNLRGPLRHVRCIGDRAYAVGMNRQVYRRDGVNQWNLIDHGVRPENDVVAGFESVDGFSEVDIYAVGYEGEIWHYNGSVWNRIESPTNQILNDVCCSENQKVYACGRLGLLLQGRFDQWEIIAHNSLTEDIWSLAWFNDELYVATMRSLCVLRGGQLVPVVFGEDVPSSFFHLTTTKGVLWSIGKKDVMAFDGKQWTRID